MNLNIFSGKAPKTARDRAAEILKEFQKIDAAIASTDKELPEAEAAEVGARTALADVEASLAIGEPVDSSAAKNAATAAAERVTSTKSRREALVARRRVREDELLELEDQLNLERHTQIDLLASEMYAKFDAAAEAFKLAIWKAQVFKLTTDRPLLLSVECTVKDMRRPLANALSVETEIDLIDVPGSDRRERVQVPLWRKSPAAQKYHAELLEAGFGIDQDVKRLTGTIRRRRSEENAAAKTEKAGVAK